MTELFFIRHGKTYGNTLGRYIGTTDEPLCEEGRTALAENAEKRLAGIRPDAVYASPMKRCLQTAEILFPGVPVRVFQELRECDFGEFENRNYQELSGNAAYQAWIDSGGALPFPGGESREGFQKRCVEGFRQVLEDVRQRYEGRTGEPGAAEGAGTEECFRAALVVHGGTIMSILSACAFPQEEYYHWQVKNGEGFRALWDETDKGGIRLYEISHIGPDSGVSA